MNRILPAALVLALLSGIVFAQQAPAPIERQDPAQQQPSTQMPPRQHHPHNPAKEAAHLSKALNLTSDQQAKLEPVLADRQQKMQALMADTSLDPKSRHQQMKAIRTSTEQQLATFLTPEQLQQLRSMHHGDAHGKKGATLPLNAAPAA